MFGVQSSGRRTTNRSLALAAALIAGSVIVASGGSAVASPHAPQLPASPQRAALRALCAGVRLACLDVGPPETLDTVVERFGLTARAERCVWTDGLGRDVRPPRPGAFRWLAARLDTRPNDIVYVAGSATTAQAAERAGWRCVRVGSDEGGDIERLLEILESTLFAS